MEVIPVIENIENVENVDKTAVFYTDLELDEEDDIKSLYSLQSLDDTPLVIDEVDEPIDPTDSILILGYYPLNPYWNTFLDVWGRQLPVADVGRTVFCGVLESDETKKVEVELCLQKPQIDYFSVLDSERTPMAPTAVAVMRRVVDYGKDMLYVVKEPFGNAIDPLPSKQVQEYSCHLFSVSDEQWYAGKRAPFCVKDDSFTSRYFS